MVVDHHGRGGETLGRIERGPEIFGEDAGLKRHGQRIRGRDRIAERREGIDAGYWAEYFEGRYFGVARRVDDDRRNQRRIAMAAAGVMLLIGYFVMARMVNFKY